MNNNKNIKFLIFLFFIFLLFIFISFSKNSNVPTIENKTYKILFDSNTGLFNVYLKKFNIYTLYYSRPLTSFLTVKFDNNVININEFKSINKNVKIQNNSIVYIWETNFLKIQEKVSFVDIDSYNQGVKLNITLTNLDIRGHFIAMGLIFDTYLGENKFKPFRIPNVGIIEQEREYYSTEIPSIIYSLDNPVDPTVGMIFYLRKAGYSIPDYVYLANFDKLKRYFWNFTYDKNNGFSNQYKKLDAGIGIKYNRKFVESNSNQSYTILIGFYPKKSSEDKTSKEETLVISKESDYIKDYTKEQIEKLNKEIVQLKNKLQKVSDSITNVENLDKLINDLNNIYKELQDLANNLESLSEEEFNKKYQDIENKIKQISDKLNQSS